VNGEEFVVGRRGDEVALRREQFQPHQSCGRAADQKEKRDRDHVEQADAFVIGREQPRTNAVRDVEIIVARFDREREFRLFRDHLASAFVSPNDFK
jgi:hypothetical protein